MMELSANQVLVLLALFTVPMAIGILMVRR